MRASSIMRDLIIGARAQAGLKPPPYAASPAHAPQVKLDPEPGRVGSDRSSIGHCLVID